MIITPALVSELLRLAARSVPPESLAKLGVTFGSVAKASVLPGALVLGGGFAAGVCLGWLTAPKSGKALRAELLEKGRELRKSLPATLAAVGNGAGQRTDLSGPSA